LRDVGLYLQVDVSLSSPDEPIWPVLNRHILDALRLPSTNICLPHNPWIADTDTPEYDTLDWQLFSSRRFKAIRTFTRHDIAGYQFKPSFLEESFKGAFKFDNPLEPNTIHVVGEFCHPAAYLSILIPPTLAPVFGNLSGPIGRLTSDSTLSNTSRQHLCFPWRIFEKAGVLARDDIPSCEDIGCLGPVDHLQQGSSRRRRLTSVSAVVPRM
jgi:hypothetical protein